VLEVRDLRAQTAQQPRQRERHARLLEAGRQVNRLDAVRNESWVARDGGERQVGCDVRELAQEVQHVGLLAGAVAPEHVRVDEDHATSS
jgi:hypothetical protein